MVLFSFQWSLEPVRQTNNLNPTNLKQLKNHKANKKNAPQNKKPQNSNNNKKTNNPEHNPNPQTPKKPTLEKQLKCQTLLRNNLIILLLVTKTSLQCLCDLVNVCAFITRPRQMVCVISLSCTKMFLELCGLLTQ